jgi:hypothetical protein
MSGMLYANGDKSMCSKRKEKSKIEYEEQYINQDTKTEILG